MMKDPIFLLLLLGTTIGTGTIGGMNIGMPQMLRQFGISESQTLNLAMLGSIGAIIGLMLYTFTFK